MIVTESQKDIFKYILKNERMIYIFFISVSIISGIEIFEPLIAKKIIDLTGDRNSFQEIISLSLFWLLIFGVKNVCRFFYKKYSLMHFLWVSRKIQSDLFRCLLYKPTEFYRKNSVGYITARLIDDIAALEGMMLNNIISGIIAIVEILIIFIFMFDISFILGILAVLLKSVNFYINFCFPLKDLYKNTNEQKAIHSKFLQDVLAGILLIKLGNAYQKEVNHYDTILDDWYNAWKKRDKVNYIRSLLSNLSMELSTMIIILLGAISIYYSWNTIGDIMAFLIFFQKLNIVLPSAINLIPLYKISQGAAERIYEFKKDLGFELKENDTGLILVPITAGNIKFVNVSLQKEGKSILKNISLEIPSKSMTVFVGQSGSGKTTVANLLLRFEKETNGYICIDQKNINDYHLLGLRDSIAYLTQDAILFNRSLKENIGYHKSIEGTEEIKELLVKTASYEMINKLPFGIETILKSENSHLSGGEKQRVALVREVLKQSKIIIFDEATASVDSITETIINQTIRELSRKATVIVITHKLSIAKEADQIYVMKDGKIEEVGTHTSLLENRGEYYQLIQNERLE